MSMSVLYLPQSVADNNGLHDVARLQKENQVRLGDSRLG
jgi:hypothetical protein